MSALECTVTSRRSFLALAAQGVVDRVRANLREIRAGHDARTAARQLWSMSDLELKDIGIHRSQISYLVHGISAPSTRITHAKD